MPSPSFNSYTDSTSIAGVYFELSGPNAISDGRLIISKETRIRFFRRSNDGIPLNLHYWVDNNSPVVYTNPFGIKEPGAHRVSFQVVDSDSGTDISTIDVLLDAGRPVVTAKIAYKSITLKEVSFGNKPDQKGIKLECPLGSEMYVSVTDDIGASKNVYLREGRASLMIVEGAIEIRSKGKHNYIILASDLVGNVTESESIELEIIEP